MNDLRGKIIETIIKNKQNFIVKTTCGLEICFDTAKDFNSWCRLRYTIYKDMKGIKIEEIVLSKNGYNIGVGNHNYVAIQVYGIKEAIRVEFSDCKNELMLYFDTFTDGLIKLHYFKTTDGWQLAQFNQPVHNNVYLEIAKEHDLINHPSVRLLTLFK
jgi:hypothetical protein